jgi:hypothetical protein
MKSQGASTTESASTISSFLPLKSDGIAAADLRIGYTRTRFEGFVGPKVGLRRERYGVFGLVQPGFARLTDKGVNCLGEVCTRMLFLLARPEYRTEFATTLGGVLEFYPSASLVARADLGTTLIRHRSFRAAVRRLHEQQLQFTRGIRI